MIEHAMKQAATVSKDPIIVCPEFLVADLRIKTPVGMRATLVPVRHTQQGAALSLLTAAGMLEDDKPVLVMDCDTIFKDGVLSQFAAFAERAFAKNYDSALLCFHVPPSDRTERYSFAAVEQTTAQFPIVKGVVEKRRVSDVASCGVHAFRTWALARRAVYENVILGVMTNGEYYLAPVHNNLVTVTAMIIQPSEFAHVGTPAEVAAYEKAQV
jgi:dTDP-glucose pyrophosphorylase